MKVREISVSYRNKNAVEHQIASPDAAVSILSKVWERDISFRERFKVVYLDIKKNVLGVYNAGSGGSAAVIVDSRQILAIALKTNADAILLAHNHPSDELQPSQHDKEITRVIQQGCDYLKVTLVDHIILNSKGEHFSFNENGLL